MAQRPLATLPISVLVIAAVSITGPPALADDQGPINTSSLLWSEADSTTAVWSGGAPVHFDPQQTGWTSAPFQELGRFGLAQNMLNVDSSRKDFSAWDETVSGVPGGVHTFDLSGLIIISSVSRVSVESTITARENSLSYDMRFADVWAGSIDNQRVYWDVDFAAGSDIVYHRPDASTLIAEDSTGQRATVVLHWEASSGEFLWGGRAVHTALLSDGDPHATAYVRNITGGLTEVSLHTFVIDYDPCGQDQARALAHRIAEEPTAWLGREIGVVSGCLGETEWSLTEGEPSPRELTLTIDPRVVDPVESTRRYLISGAPSFLDIAVDDSVRPAMFRVTNTSADIPGSYSIDISSWREDTSASVAPREAPLEQTIPLTIVSAPPPPPEPEPEPELVEVPETSAPIEEPTNEVSEQIPSQSPSSVTTRPSTQRGSPPDDILALAPPVPSPPAAAAETPPPDDQPPAPAGEPEPDFQLQESSPPIPLPVEPRLELANPAPPLNIWREFWWLWVISGGSLIWWAVIGLRPKRRRDNPHQT